MSEDAKSVVAAREIYTACLQDFLTGAVMVGFATMYEVAKADTPKGRTPLRQFQIVLSETPSWNQNRIDAEVKRICRDSSESYLEDLITTILVSNAEILSSINLHGKTNKIQLKIPKVGNFVHAVYVCVARRLYKEIYVFDEDAKATEKQRNMRRCEEIVREAILTVLQDNLPIHDIIRQYVTGGGDAKEAIEEVSDLLEDPDIVPEAISPESVSIIEEDAEPQGGDEGAEPQEGEEDAPADEPGSPVEAVEEAERETAKTDPVGDEHEEQLEEIDHDTSTVKYPGDAVGRVDRQIGREDDDDVDNDDVRESNTEKAVLSDQDGGELVAMELPSNAHYDSAQASEQDKHENGTGSGDDTNGSIVIDISDIAGVGDSDNDDEAGGYGSEEAANGSDEDAQDVPAPRVGAGREDSVDKLPKMVITPKDEESAVEIPEPTHENIEDDGERESSGPSNAETDDVDPISDGEFEDYDWTDEELTSDRDDMGELIKRIKTGTIDGPSKAEVFFGDLVPKKKQTAELVRNMERKDTKGKRASVSSAASSSDGGLTDGDSKRIILPEGLDLEASDDQAVKRPRRRRAKKRVQLFPDAKSDTAAED